MPTATKKHKRPKSKPTWNDVQAKIANYDCAGLMQLISDLYALHRDNRAMLHARFALGVNPLDEYKKRIGAALAPEFYPTDDGDISVVKAKRAISEYTKAIGDPLGVLELRVFWCETAVAYSMEFGYADDDYFDVLMRQYRGACRTLTNLDDKVAKGLIERLLDVRNEAYIGYGVHDHMCDLMNDVLLKFPNFDQFLE